jgi:hypothetical protein
LLRIGHAPNRAPPRGPRTPGKQFQPGFCACTSVGATQDYSLSNFSTTDLGGGVTLVFDSLTRFTLQEAFLVGTLALFGDTVSLKPGVDFTLQDNVIAFPAATQNVTVRYQTSAYSQAGLVARKTFYTPYLYEFRFDSL